VERLKALRGEYQFREQSSPIASATFPKEKTGWYQAHLGRVIKLRKRNFSESRTRPAAFDTRIIFDACTIRLFPVVIHPPRKKEQQNMAHPILAFGVAALALGLAFAGVQAILLPAQACNAGTAQAHASIPPTLPNGTANPGQSHVPAMVNGNCTTPHA
jgi:hypothetical protein